MKYETIIWGLLLIAGVYVLVKLYYKICWSNVDSTRKEIHDRKRKGKNFSWLKLAWALFIGILLVAKLVSQVYKLDKTNTTEHPQATTTTNNQPVINSSDNELYFVGFPFFPPQVNFVKCSFTESSPASCEIQCSQLEISYETDMNQLKEKVQCQQDKKITKYADKLELSETYYVESYATCVEDKTYYKVFETTTEICPDISCRLLKKDVMLHDGFYHCRPYNFPSWTRLITKDDFIEFTEPKMRSEDEFKNLYKKYYTRRK